MHVYVYGYVCIFAPACPLLPDIHILFATDWQLFISLINLQVFYQTRPIFLWAILLWAITIYKLDQFACLPSDKSHIVVGHIVVLFWGILLYRCVLIYCCGVFCYIIVRHILILFWRLFRKTKSSLQIHALYVQTHICLHACVFERYRNMSLFPIDIDLFSERVPHQLMQHTKQSVCM